jgi:hypothetical protein
MIFGVQPLWEFENSRRGVHAESRSSVVSGSRPSSGRVRRGVEFYFKSHLEESGVRSAWGD